MKKRGNSRQRLTPTQTAWLAGKWLLGVDNAGASSGETMEALALIANIGGKSEALWLAHGDEEKFFWRKGMRSSPITREELEDHEARWLTPDNDPYGGESYFVHTYYSDNEKIALWRDFGDKENFQWEPVLRRPIPIGASIDSAMVAFTGIGPFNIK